MPSSRVLFDAASMPLPRPSRWRWWWRIALALVLAAWSLWLLAWLTLHWGILPNARAWLPQIEQRATRALGVPVRIGDVQVRTGRWVPAVELRDVVLLDAEGREALRLDRVAAALAARSLLTLDWRLQQVVLDGAVLEVRRDAAGAVHVAGFPLDAGGDDDGALAAWFFHQREFVVRDGRVRWVDEKRAAPPLELQAVDIVVRNGARRHEFRLDATPPVEWGERFSLRGRFTAPLLGERDAWRRWSGSVYAELPRVDVARLREHATLPFDWSAGEGALRAWVDVAQGEPTAATLDVAARDVALRLAADLAPLQLRQAQGRFTGRRDADALNLAATGFGFVDAEGRTWPRSDLRVALRQRRDGGPDAPVTGGELRADRLDLGLLAMLAGRVPLGVPARALLDELRPAGVVEALQVRWDGPVDAPSQFRVQARASGLAIAAGPLPAEGLGRPGWSGATIEFDATERGGRAQLAIADGVLVLPGVFEQPAVPLQRLAAGLEWRIEPAGDAAAPRVEVRVRDARFANADARGSFDAAWRTGDGTGFGPGGRYPGRLELNGRLDAARADAVARYLPLGLPESTRRYVERAVRGGRLSEGRFRVDGDLWEFPFAGPGSGVFRVTARASDVDFAYVPDEPGWVSPWPAFAAVAGELEFDRASMTVRDGVGRFYGVELGGVTATIADLVGAPVLQLDGLAQGPAADLLRYLEASPVGGWLDHVLAQTTATGRGRLRLALSVPLTDPERSTVRGTLALDGNDVRIAAGVPLLAQARGEIDFTGDGFALRDVRARALGGELELAGGTDGDGALRLEARGRAQADALRTYARAEAPAWAALAATLGGSAAYRLRLDWAADGRGGPAFELASDLVGLTVDLPAPLAKPADAAWPLQVSATPVPAPAGPLRDDWRLALGPLLDVHLRREHGADERVTVLAGGIGVGRAAPPPEAGVAVAATLDRLDVDAWRTALDRLGVLGGGTGGGPGGGPGGGGWAGVLPQRLALEARELRAGGRRLTQVVADVRRPRAGPWRAAVSADQLSGTVEWRRGSEGGAGAVRARLARLALPPAEGAAGTAAPPARPPAAMPSLDLVVDDFAVDGKRLGRLEIDAVDRPAPGGGREWQLARLRVDNADARLAASGRWRPAGGGAAARMAADFTLDIDDAGALLARLGAPDALLGGSGRVSGDVAWQGAPLVPDVPTLDGRLQLALRAGRFPQADSGAARLLSVLSLRALPRRLTLDFRDVFEQGFAFDEASGDVTIASGVARTNNLRMRGLQAGVLMEGQADLARETQDLRVIVVPEVNAATASLLYSIINPAVGLGTFVAQLFLRQPLMEAGTREFRITGRWDEPQVERVERAAAVPQTPSTQ